MTPFVNTSTRNWRPLLAGFGIWAFWVVAPAATLTTSPQAFATAQIGAASVGYLSSAPAALCWYLVLGQCVALPALIALAWALPGRASSLESRSEATARWLSTSVRFFGSWATLYCLGDLLIAVVDWRRGADPSVVRGYALYLGMYGLLATLPQCGWVLAQRFLIRRAWLSAAASLLTGALLAVVSLVLQQRRMAWPTPAFLRNQLFSGRADLVASAEWRLLLWCVVPSALALLWLTLPTLSRSRSIYCGGG